MPLMDIDGLSAGKRFKKQEFSSLQKRSHKQQDWNEGVSGTLSYSNSVAQATEQESRRLDEDEQSEDEEFEAQKKDKKLVFLSRSVLEKIREKPMTTGTQIANEILDLYKQFCEVRFHLVSLISIQKVDFKNVQRRVYDALNVLHAMDIIRKDKSMIVYHKENDLLEPQFDDQQESSSYNFKLNRQVVNIENA